MGLRKRTPDERIENALRRSREHLTRISDLLITLQTMQPFCRSRSAKIVQQIEDMEIVIGAVEGTAGMAIKRMGGK